MSEMKTKVVLTCSQCGRPYVLAHLETAQPDPDGSQLNELMRMEAKNGLCPRCVKVHNYKAEQELKGEQTDYVLRPSRF